MELFKEVAAGQSVDSIAEEISAMDDVKLLADYDALPYGDENFRTAHFGWTGPGKTGLFVEVHTNGQRGTWSVTVGDPQDPYNAVRLGFEREVVVKSRNGGGSSIAYDDPADIPEPIVNLVRACEAAGLKEFTFTGQAAPALAPGA